MDIYLRAFTTDATLSLFGGKQVLKVSDISDIVASGKIVVPHEHTSHAPSNQVVTVTGDAATADTLVTCHLVGADGRVQVRGLRYLNDLVRTADGWRISHRQHFVLWQYEARRVEPTM